MLRHVVCDSFFIRGRKVCLENMSFAPKIPALPFSTGSRYAISPIRGRAIRTKIYGGRTTVTNLSAECVRVLYNIPGTLYVKKK